MNLTVHDRTCLANHHFADFGARWIWLFARFVCFKNCLVIELNRTQSNLIERLGSEIEPNRTKKFVWEFDWVQFSNLIEQCRNRTQSNPIVLNQTQSNAIEPSGTFDWVRLAQFLCESLIVFDYRTQSSTFLCRPLQNKNVKWPNLKFHGECEHTTANSPFSIWTWPPFLQIQLLDSSATLDKLN